MEDKEEHTGTKDAVDRLKTLGSVEILNADNQSVPMSSLWSSQDDFNKRRQDFEAKGVRLCFIGLGALDRLSNYAKELNVKVEDIFTDPQRNSYKELELIVPSKWKLAKGTFNSENLKGLRSASSRGFKLLSTPSGDIKQMGGIAVIDPNEGVTFLHRSQTASDYPTPEEVLAKL